MKSKEHLSRRTFFRRFAQLSAAGLGAGTLLAACTSESEQQAAGDTAAEASPCTDLSGLTEQQKQTRQTFKYVNDSPKPEQQCNNCQFWIPPEGDAPCGKCTIVRGPIDPQGWCTAWAAQPAG